jgi:hypothetical protein
MRDSPQPAPAERTLPFDLYQQAFLIVDICLDMFHFRNPIEDVEGREKRETPNDQTMGKRRGCWDACARRRIRAGASAATQTVALVLQKPGG